MFPSVVYSGCTFLLLITLSRAVNLPSLADLTSFAPLSPPTNKTFLINASTTPDFLALALTNSLGADNADPVCNGGLLGYDMNQHSCLQTWSTIPTGRRQYTFGDRLNGTFDVQLPRRFSGPDGTCVIDIFHKDGEISDKTTFAAISRAAENLYRACVTSEDQRSQGGYIRDIGVRRNLVIVLSLYTPVVACFGPRALMSSAVPLLSLIPVGTERQTFGPEGEPGVQVVLPITYGIPPLTPHGDYGLKLEIHLEHRGTVNARWFDVWAGAAAVNAMCTVRGYAGTSGVTSGLSVTLQA